MSDIVTLRATPERNSDLTPIQLRDFVVPVTDIGILFPLHSLLRDSGSNSDILATYMLRNSEISGTYRCLPHVDLGTQPCLTCGEHAEYAFPTFSETPRCSLMF